MYLLISGFFQITDVLKKGPIQIHSMQLEGTLNKNTVKYNQTFQKKKEFWKRTSKEIFALFRYD